MAYSKVHSRHELGNLVFYEAGNRQRWLDAIGPNAIVFKEDFAADILDNWTGTAVAGTTGVSSYDAEGGAILLYTAGSDNDGYQLQKLEGFKAIDDCPIYFGARWKITGMAGGASAGVLLGLANIDATLLAAEPDDGIFFHSGSAEAGLNFALATGGTSTDIEALAAVVAETWYIDEFYWDGDTIVKGWHNGAYIGSQAKALMDQTQTLTTTRVTNLAGVAGASITIQMECWLSTGTNTANKGHVNGVVVGSR